MSKRLNSQMERLLDVLSTDPDQPTDVSAAIAAAPPVGTLPPPQVTWAWLGFTHYLERKRWAWELVREHVQPLPPDHWRVQGFGAPQYDYQGLIPGLPEWECSLRGLWGHLVHRMTGAQIRLELDEEPTVVIVSLDLVNYYLRGEPTDGFGYRVRELIPYRTTWRYFLSLLRRAGLLDGPNDEVYRLSLAGKRHAPFATRLLAACSAPGEHLRLAVLIGDWPWARTLARSECPDLLGQIEPRAEECRRRWLARLHRSYRTDGLCSELLYALAAAEEPHLARFLREGIRSKLARTVTDIAKDDPSWCDAVFKLLRGAVIRGDNSVNVKACAEYLGRHGYRVRETMKLLQKMRPRPWAALIRLALRGEPEQLIRILPRALRSVEDGLTAVAVLALLDSDWSRQVLVAFLDSWKSPILRPSECLAALEESRDVKAIQAAKQWVERNPLTGDFDSHEHQLTKKQLRERMQELADTVYPVRKHLSGGG